MGGHKMAKSVWDEKLISFAQAIRFIRDRFACPRISDATLGRWATLGISTPQGRLRLEAIRAGAAWRTSEEAIIRFFRARTEMGAAA